MDSLDADLMILEARDLATKWARCLPEEFSEESPRIMELACAFILISVKLDLPLEVIQAQMEELTEMVVRGCKDSYRIIDEDNNR